MSRFDSVAVVPPIEVFNVNRLANEDTHPDKVNLSIGAYRSEEGKPWVLPVVREAEKKLAADESVNHEYLQILGWEEFSREATKLLLGPDHPAIKQGKTLGVQSLSGTGSLRNGAEFLARVLQYTTVAVSKPTWGNHKMVFPDAGVKEVREYTYWSQEKRAIDFDAYIRDLESFPQNTVVLLHGCAHNPTGSDPTQAQWKKLCEVMKAKRLFPFFDIAYQGFASGDPDKDAWSVRYFAEQGMELFCAQSFAKNFGLYNERVGNLTMIVNDPSKIPAVKSQMSRLVRGCYSNPPAHGARIVTMVLKDPSLKAKWFDSIRTMSGRIIEMRKQLRAKLEALKTPGTWQHITDQIGMFSFTGLTPEQSQQMATKHHIYMLKSGRISMCGITTKNVDHVARSIHDVVTSG